MKKILYFICCLPLFLNAQNFVEVSTDILPLTFASADFGDYDNDGDQDLVVIGVTGESEDKTIIYRNDDGVFTDIMASLPVMHMGAVNWVDYDMDGDLDLFCSGQDYAFNYYAVIFKNSDGNFGETNINLPVGFWNSAGWGDFDNDGDMDLAYSWYSESTSHSAIYRNDGGTFVDLELNMQGLTEGSMEWGDFDNDGDLDLLQTGTTTDFSKTLVTIYVNNDGDFTEGDFDFLDCTWYNNVLWSDVDNDGDLDIVYVADEDGQYPFVYYKNTDGDFELNYTGFYGVRTSNGNIGLAQGDIDNDGDVDFVMTGDNPSYNKFTKIFLNEDGVFSELIHSIPGFGSGTVDITDLDNDGDLDLFMTGYDQASNTVVGLFINDNNSNTYSANEAPDTPAELTSVVDVNNVLLTWLPASDDHTPQESLNYNLYVGSSPGNYDIVSAQSIIDESSEDFGFHFVPKPGNCQMSLQHMLFDLPDGIYYWSVQAIDQSGVASVFAEEQSFQIGDVTNTNAVEKSIHIYPNPANDYVWIDLSDDLVSVEIYNINGQLVYNNDVLQKNSRLDISKLSGGTYLLKLITKHQMLVKELNIIK